MRPQYFIDPIGYLTRHLPVCSTMPQPTAPSRVPPCLLKVVLIHSYTKKKKISSRKKGVRSDMKEG